MQKFTHLHVHSHYSLLDGLAKIDQLLDYVKELGMDSVALTDHGVLYGAVEFYKKAKAKGIKPIIGCEVYTAFERMQQKRPKIDDKRYHLILLAKNEQGYKNLVKLTTKAHLEGFYYKPRIDDELLFQHCQGLICLSGCVQGKIPKLINNGEIKKAEELALKYKKMFGPDNFYLEIQEHPNLPEQVKANAAMIVMSRKLSIPLAATNDIHYLKREDADAQDILMLINTNANPNDAERLTMKADDFSMKSPEQMIKFCQEQGAPEAVSNTEKIVEQCNFEFELDQAKLPYFPVPNDKSADQYLKELCLGGLNQKKEQLQNKDQAIERLEYELSVIKETGFAPYFLIVQDFVNWAKQNRIVVGPGRGCLLPNTKILMKDGRQKNIEEVKPGEKVITHLANKRKVKKVLVYDVNEEVAIIESKMPTFKLKLTKDHQVLVVKHRMCSVKSIKETICKPSCRRACRKKIYKNYKLKWMKARDLKKNDFLVYPISKHRRSKVEFDLLRLNNLDNHLKGDNTYVWYEIGTNKLIPKKIKRFIKLDKKLARLFGFYISEGWTRTSRKQGLGTIGFGFHKNEIENIKEVRNLLKQVFGLDSSLKFHKTRNSCQVLGYSRIVARFFERLCGKYALNKHIPYQIFGLDNKIVISLLTSLFKGDGSNKGTMRLSFDSISFSLVSQVKMLLGQLGIMSSIKIREHEGKNWHSSYKLRVSGEQLFRFNKLFPEFQVPIRKQKFYRNDTFIWKNYICFPVKKVFFAKYKGKVYDLTVEKDTSYVANNITVHNSVGGSLIAYLLNITEVDPLKHDLLFERFLNKERVSMPDIDLDFADSRRDEVIEYVAQKYGKNKVAQIITFGTMAARAVIRDVGRAMGLSYSFCDRTAKMIPFGMDLQEALNKVAEFKRLYQTDEQAVQLIDTARKLEGVARHASTHACGVVIAKEPLTELVPLQHPTQNDEHIVTQYEMHAIEDLGLLKMDFLGLKNLTIIEDTLAKIYVIRKEKLDISKIPFNDEKTFQLFQSAQTTGVFQCESQGFKRYLQALKPTVFNDIVAMVALYRPGPMELIPEYIARKHGRKSVEYIHPSLKSVLEPTYGLPIFQEQIMQIARILAGFSLSEADVLRKAIGKKIKDLLEAQRKKFIQGCVKNNVSQDIAQKVFQWIEPHASYSFNKSHAAAYAMLAYQTAYLKAHYPLEFMASLLTSEKGDVERIAFLIEECKNMNIEVLPPDINESYRHFSVVAEKNKIRFGLLAIKNVGHNVVTAIVEERKQAGPFRSVEDFIKRVPSREVNKRSLESLIKAGAFDKMAERNQLLHNLEKLLQYNRERQQQKANGQKGLFDNTNYTPALTLAPVAPAAKKELLQWEKELLGLFVSSHPLEEFKKIFSQKTIALSKVSHLFVNKRIKVGGIISKIKKITTRNGNPMLFVNIEDQTDRLEVVAFPNILERNPSVFQENKIVLISGRVDMRDGSPKLIADQVEEIVEP